jgi:hypothetical protein
MMADFYFACANCGPQEDPLGDGHGCCTVCGAELVRLKIPPFPEPQPDGIAKHFGQETPCIST